MSNADIQNGSLPLVTGTVNEGGIDALCGACPAMCLFASGVVCYELGSTDVLPGLK